MKKYFNKINSIYFFIALLIVIAISHIDIILASVNQYFCSFEISDLKYYINIRDYAFDCIKRFCFPLWTTKMYCGLPFFANTETAIFYLPNVLFFFLPVSKAINFSFLLHFFILSFSVFLWINNKIKDKFIAFIVAIIAVFNSSFYLHYYAAHLSNIITMAWFPLLLYLYDKAFKQKTYFYIFPVTFVISLQLFAGHLQYTYYTALVSFLYILFFCRRKNVFVTIFSSYLIVLLLSSVQLLPGIDFYFEGGRRVGMLEVSNVFLFLKLKYLLTFLFPVTISQTHTLFWEMSNYIGALSFLIVLMAIFHIHNKQIFKYLSIILFLYLLTFQTTSNLFANIIPFFDWFRGHVKITFFANILLLPILAYGIKFILLKKLKINLFFILFMLIFSLSILFFNEKLATLMINHNMDLKTISYSLKELSVLFLTFSILLCLKKHLFFSMVIVLLTAIEPIIVMKLYSEPATIKNNYKYDYIAKEDFNKQPRFYAYKRFSLKYAAENVVGSAPDKLKNYMTFFKRDHNDNILGILRCKYIINSETGLRSTLKNDTLNRINVFYDYSVEQDKEEIYKKLYSESFDIFNIVILEKEPAFKPQAKGEYKINILSFEENSIDFECETTEPAVILYTDNYSKGWKAYEFDNPKQKYEIICADYIYKSISVDKGYHKIRFEYKPITFFIGMWISIVSWIFFLGSYLIIMIKKSRKLKSSKIKT